MQQDAHGQQDDMVYAPENERPLHVNSLLTTCSLSIDRQQDNMYYRLCSAAWLITASLCGEWRAYRPFGHILDDGGLQADCNDALHHLWLTRTQRKGPDVSRQPALLSHDLAAYWELVKHYSPAAGSGQRLGALRHEANSAFEHGITQAMEVGALHIRQHSVHRAALPARTIPACLLVLHHVVSHHDAEHLVHFAEVLDNTGSSGLECRISMHA